MRVHQSEVFLALLAQSFIALKLTEVVAWSWWMVLAPLWVPPVLTLALIVPGFFLWRYLLHR